MRILRNRFRIRIPIPNTASIPTVPYFTGYNKNYNCKKVRNWKRSEGSPTCIGGSAEPVRDPLFRQVILQSAGMQRQRLAPVVRPRVEQKLPAARLVNERTDERPEDGKDARRADNEDAAQRLRIVGLADLDDVEEGLDAGPPQVPHVQALCKKSPRGIVYTWRLGAQGGGLGYMAGQWIRIHIRNPDPDSGGQKWPTKVEKIKKFHEVLDPDPDPYKLNTDPKPWNIGRKMLIRTQNFFREMVG